MLKPSPRYTGVHGIIFCYYGRIRGHLTFLWAKMVSFMWFNLMWRFKNYCNKKAFLKDYKVISLQTDLNPRNKKVLLMSKVLKKKILTSI